MTKEEELQALRGNRTLKSLGAELLLLGRGGVIDLNYHPSSDCSFCPLSEGVPGGKTAFYA